jgi:hypothetical protein
MRESLVWYFCERRQDWFPVPLGYVAPYSSEETNDDPFTSSMGPNTLHIPL